MSNPGLQINGLPTSMTSSALNTTAPLSAGVYAVWSTPVNAYIACGTPPSTALAGSSNGYPVVGGAAPVQISMPTNGQISAISTAANLLLYQKVG